MHAPVCRLPDRVAIHGHSELAIRMVAFFRTLFVNAHYKGVHGTKPGGVVRCVAHLNRGALSMLAQHRAYGHARTHANGMNPPEGLFRPFTLGLAALRAGSGHVCYSTRGAARWKAVCAGGLEHGVSCCHRHAWSPAVVPARSPLSL